MKESRFRMMQIADKKYLERTMILQDFFLFDI